MVRFEKDKNGEDIFTLSIKGEPEKYIAIIKSLLYYLSMADDSVIIHQSERYDICSLISDMLPNEKQIISSEEYEIFQQFKAKNITKNL
jgi:hypothetical protein